MKIIVYLLKFAVNLIETIIAITLMLMIVCLHLSPWIVLAQGLAITTGFQQCDYEGVPYTTFNQLNALVMSIVAFPVGIWSIDSLYKLFQKQKRKIQRAPRKLP